MTYVKYLILCLGLVACDKNDGLSIRSTIPVTSELTFER